jgi:hypothetical protein
MKGIDKNDGISREINVMRFFDSLEREKVLPRILYLILTQISLDFSTMRAIEYSFI